MMENCLECGRNDWVISVQSHTTIEILNGEVADKTGADEVEYAECNACGEAYHPGEEGLSRKLCAEILWEAMDNG